jgi:hypothetical protein
MQDPNEICGVVDVKGFYLNHVYYVRECAIISNNINVCQEFNPKILYSELDERDKKHISNCTRKKHGLNYKPHHYSRLFDSNKIGEFIKFCYDMIKTDYSNKLAIKNGNLNKILEDYKIPYVDLSEDIYIPSNAKLEWQLKQKCYYEKWVCSFHHYTKNVNCAYHKCYLIWKYIYDLKDYYAEHGQVSMDVRTCCLK